MPKQDLLIEANKLGEYVLSQKDNLIDLLQKAYKKNTALVASGNRNLAIERMVEDVVTKTDIEIGDLYVKMVFGNPNNFPNVKVDSEEESQKVGDGPITLRLDPVDGSKHLHEGIGYFSSCASISVDNQIVWGMVIDAITGEVFHANKEGAYLNGNKMTVNTRSIGVEAYQYNFVFYEAPTSRLAKTNHDKFDKFCKFQSKLQENAFRTRNFGLSSLGICGVAASRFAAFLDLSGTIKLYDVEAAIFVARQAGLRITSLDGLDITEIKFNKDSDKKMISIESLLIGSTTACQQILDLV